mmetsp:Transcript_79150/g.220028  ORF Transcript_79150/g.220028 Transcript_79150/m.220028 type:complete len:110 (-) Transcript_79150:213-542(-)
MSGHFGHHILEVKNVDVQQTSISRNTSGELFARGDLCITVSPVALRKEESLSSQWIVEVPGQTMMVVLQTGVGRRLQVRLADNSMTGWVSFKTKSNEALLERKVICRPF